MFYFAAFAVSLCKGEACAVVKTGRRGQSCQDHSTSSTNRCFVYIFRQLVYQMDFVVSQCRPTLTLWTLNRLVTRVRAAATTVQCAVSFSSFAFRFGAVQHHLVAGALPPIEARPSPPSKRVRCQPSRGTRSPTHLLNIHPIPLCLSDCRRKCGWRRNQQQRIKRLRAYG